jgi:potassium-dependent mechanosensitive channel
MFTLQHILFLSLLSGLPADPPANDSSKAAKGGVAKPTEAPAEWNETRIAARIRRTEESKELKPEEKLKILELYKSAQNGFKKAEEWKTRTDSMERLSASAPEDAKKLRQEAKTTSGMDPMAGVQDRSVKGLEAKLKQAKLQLEEAEKAVAESEAEPARRANRRRELPELRQAAQKKQQDSAKKPLETQAGDPEEVLTARKAIRFAYTQSLKAEINCYTKELAYLDATNDLVGLERDNRLRQAVAAKKVLAAVTEELNHVRKVEAEIAARKAEEAKEETRVDHPLLTRAVEENKLLAKRRSKIAADIEAEGKKAAELRQTVADLKAKEKNAQEKITRSGLNAATGQELRQRQTELERLANRRDDIRARRRSVERAQVDLLDLEDRRSMLADVEEVVAVRLQTEPPPDALRSVIRDDLLELLQNQQELLDGLLADHQSLLDKFVEAEAAAKELVVVRDRFGDYISERVLWLRSASLFDKDDTLAVAAAVRHLGDPEQWKNAGRFLWNDAKANPRTSAALLVSLVLWLCCHEWMRRRLKKLGEEVDHNYLNTFGLTVRSLFLTALMSAMAPTVMGYLGWRLDSSPDAPEFARAIGAGLWSATVVFATIEVLRQIFRRHGVADSHFRWRSATVLQVRRHLTLLWPIATPAAFIVGLTEAQHNEVWKNSLGRLAFVVGMGAFGFFLFRVFRPRGSIMQDLLGNKQDGWVYRLRNLWFPVLAGSPVAMAGLAIEGHYFTAFQLTKRLLPSFWTLMAVVLLHAIAIRWLFTARGRLALDRAKARRENQATDNQAPSAAISANEVDLTTVNLHIRRLVSTGLTVGLTCWLWFLWADALPAFGPVTQYAMWTVDRDRIEMVEKTGGGATEPQTIHERINITPLHGAAALGLLWITFVVAGSLPGLAEIMLKSACANDPGGRYAITTLMRYAITILGTVIAASVIGVGWAQVQWLVAGMTVGLGFGLQEIFANFVSGIILLFERPIRLGDQVTVGDITGTVTKIRIRAATIIDANRRELVVPNREFITGRVINWTLTDRSTRVQVRVGVSYGTDPDEAMTVMMDAAKNHPDVLPDPAPNAVFETFGDSTLNMVLNCYVANIDITGRVKHELNTAVARMFHEKGIECAYPHCDVTVRGLFPEAKAVVDRLRQSA